MMPYLGLLPCTTSSNSSVVVRDHGPLRSIFSSLSWVRSNALSGSMALLFLCQTVACSSFFALVRPCTPRSLRHSLFVRIWARFSGTMITHALFCHILSLTSFSPSGCELLWSSLCLWLALTYPFQVCWGQHHMLRITDFPNAVFWGHMGSLIFWNDVFAHYSCILNSCILTRYEVFVTSEPMLYDWFINFRKILLVIGIKRSRFFPKAISLMDPMDHMSNKERPMN